MLNIRETVRTAIQSCSESQNAIAREAGIDKSLLSRFLKGERGLSIESLERLCKYLGLRFIATRKGKKGK